MRLPLTGSMAYTGSMIVQYHPLRRGHVRESEHLGGYANKPVGAIDRAVLQVVGDYMGIPWVSVPRDGDIVDDLGADSLDLVELLINLEEVFGIQVPEEQLTEIKIVDDLIRLVEQRTDGGRQR